MKTSGTRAPGRRPGGTRYRLQATIGNSCIAAVCTAAVVAAAAMPAQAQTFKGKTINIYVGYSAGGGTDAAARLIASHLGKHVTGSPNVIVRNMPGGGGIRAHNYVFEKAKPDGLALLYAPSAIQGQLLERPGVRFDYTKFTIIAPFITAPSVIYARNDAVPGGLKKPADIVKAPRLVFAGLRASSSLAIWSVASLNLLGVKYRFVAGYRGTAPMVAAVRKGEANISATSLQGIRSTVEPALVDKGVGSLLWYFPVKDQNGNWLKSDEAGSIANFLDVYKAVHGKAPAGKEWERFLYWVDVFSLASTYLMGPPGMDAKPTAELREALRKLIADKDYIAAQKKTFGFAARLASPEKTAERMKQVVDANNEHLKYWQGYLAKLGK